MGDHDRNREPARDTDRTTIVHTDGGRGGGGGVVIAIILVAAVAVLAFILFGGNLGKVGDKVGVNVNVDTPKIEVPDINVKIPDINVQLPKVDVKTEDKAEGNKSN